MNSFSQRIVLFAGLLSFAAGLFFILGRPQPTREPERARADQPGEAMRWFYQQRAYPAEAIPLDWKQRAVAHIEKNNVAKAGIFSKGEGGISALAWTEVGPYNMGGRLRAIAVSPSDASVLFAGSVSGGVWKSTDGGSSWSSTNDFADNLAITAIRIDPTNSNILYASTGEGFFNVDAVRGAGVLKSTDGGSSWTLQTGFTGGNFPYYINDLYLRPDNVSTLYAATNSGLYRTTNGGTSWTFLHQGTSARATQIVADAGSPATFYVSYGNFSTDGIYKTTNGGTNFSKLTSGLPSSGYHRVSLAISASNPAVLYAVFSSSSTYGTLGIYKTTNNGSSWSPVTTPTDPLNGGTHTGTQAWYDNVIAVDPSNENTVMAGGINLYKSTNGGTNWTMVSNWYPGAGYPYVHADQHAIVYSGSNIYFGNDGGFYRSTDGGVNFSEMNNGLATIQFYSGAIHPTLDVYYGGTQDNGTLKSGTLPNWSAVFGGDGGATAVNYNSPSTVYTEYVYLCFQRSTNSGTSWARSMSGIPTSGSSEFDGTSDRCLFIAPFRMDPTDPQRIAAGTYCLYYTTDGGGSWSAISPDLTGDGSGSVGNPGSTVSTIAIAKTTSAVIYAGTSGYPGLSASRVLVTTNTGGNWFDVTDVSMPNRYVTSIAIDAGNADRAVACFSGYSSSTPSTPGHVFLTTDGGVSWANASGNLPDIPVNASVIDPLNPQHLIVGTDLGVFESINEGSTWTQQNSGLANVVVSDLDLRGDGYLFAATHGRGMFKTTTPLAVRETPPSVVQSFELYQNYPNPFNPATEIRYRIASGGFVSLKVFDLTGREVATLVNGQKAAGTYAAAFDASGLASGVYFYRLHSGSQTISRKMLLTK